MKILVTGADGQLGRAIQNAFPGDTLFPFRRSELDITVLSQIRSTFSRTKPDLVVNCAAYNHVDKAESDEKKAFDVNERGPQYLAEVSAEMNVPIVHVSTDYVFDGKNKSPYTEDDAVNPLSVYARSKLAGENAVSKTNKRHFIVRTAWVYHVHGKNFFSALLPQANDERLRVVSDQFSSPTYAPHLADGIARLVRTAPYGTYHLAGQGVASRHQQLKLFFERLGIHRSIGEISMDEFPHAAVRPRFSALTTARQPKILLPPWEQGVSEYVKELEATHAM